MNNQNNSSAPAKEGELSIGDTVKTLNVDWADGENCADKFGTVERLDPDEMDGAVEVRFKDGSGIVCLPRQLTKVARGSSGADRVQGGLTDEEICQIAESIYGTLATPQELAFARAILSRQSMMGSEVRGETEDDAAIRERDYNADMADKLAAGIAEHFGQDIGEHSSANCPWTNALEILDTKPEFAPCAGTSTPANAAATNGDGFANLMRDMLAIQEACGLHTDEYAPGSVIEYIKELEADIAAADEDDQKGEAA